MFVVAKLHRRPQEKQFFNAMKAKIRKTARIYRVFLFCVVPAYSHCFLFDVTYPIVYQNHLICGIKLGEIEMNKATTATS